MPYVDGFVIPLPKKNTAAYKKMATLGCKVWMEHGASAYFECVGDDLKTKFGVPMTKLAGAKPTETVVFAWIVYKDKATRNKVNKAVMKDPRISGMVQKMPFDCNKMSMGGFKVLVQG